MKSKISLEEFFYNDNAQKILDFFGYPQPEITFIESLQRKLSYRNHFHLFRRECDLTGKKMLSIIPPEMPFKVYEKTAWFGDGWDAMEYGRDYDFNRKFFEQFYDLQKDVPIFNLQNVNSENSEYCSSVSDVKDCYLAFATYQNSQDIYYSYNAMSSRDLYYCNFSNNLENCFYCYNCKNGYQNVGCEYCFNCNDCFFSYSIESCKDCIFCSNLKNKQYYIFNKKYSKEEYTEAKKKLNLGSHSSLMKAFQRLEQIKFNAISRANYQLACENCTGNELVRSKDCTNTFNISDCENTSDTLAGSKSFNCFRSYGLIGNEFSYETCATLNATNSSFIIYGYHIYDCHYSINLHNCKHCFGCVGLRNKEYCIFNKQYTKEAYESLKAEIINCMKKNDYNEISFDSPSKEWGSYFPMKYSYLPYNYSISMMHWKMEKESALKQGFLWHDPENENISQKMVYDAPDNIQDWSENMDHKVLICEKTRKSFNLLSKVIKKFKSENIHFIYEHPIENILRVCGQSKYKLIERTSSKSGIKLKTTFSDNEHPKIYSEDEYREEFL